MVDIHPGYGSSEEVASQPVGPTTSQTVPAVLVNRCQCLCLAYLLRICCITYADCLLMHEEAACQPDSAVIFKVIEMVVVSRCCCKWRGRREDVIVFMQAVRLLHEEVASQPEGACGDMLVLPIYAALPPELQVMHPPLQSTLCSSRLEKFMAQMRSLLVDQDDAHHCVPQFCLQDCCCMLGRCIEPYKALVTYGQCLGTFTSTTGNDKLYIC